MSPEDKEAALNEAVEDVARAIDQLAVDYANNRVDMPPDGRGCAIVALRALLSPTVTGEPSLCVLRAELDQVGITRPVRGSTTGAWAMTVPEVVDDPDSWEPLYRFASPEEAPGE